METEKIYPPYQENSTPPSPEPDLWQGGYDSTKHKGFLSNLGGHFIDFIQSFVVIAAIFALLYLFVAQPHKVSGLSMFPTFHNGDYILTDKVSYKLGQPQRGDVIVFKAPTDETDDFIKRIMAIPGDTIKIEDNTVYVNNSPVNEYYLKPEVVTNPKSYLTEGKTVTVGKDEVFAFGDNREHSSDSREWGGVPKKNIIGKAFFRYWPPGSIGPFKALP